MKLYYSQVATSNQFVDIEIKIIKNKDTKNWGVWAFCTPYSMHILTGTTTREEGNILKILLCSSKTKYSALLDRYQNILQGLHVEVNGYISFSTFSTKLKDILMEMVKENEKKETKCIY